jgi:hypothetical protein
LITHCKIYWYSPLKCFFVQFFDEFHTLKSFYNWISSREDLFFQRRNKIRVLLNFWLKFEPIYSNNEAGTDMEYIQIETATASRKTRGGQTINFAFVWDIEIKVL